MRAAAMIVFATVLIVLAVIPAKPWRGGSGQTAAAPTPVPVSHETLTAVPAGATAASVPAPNPEPTTPALTDRVLTGGQLAMVSAYGPGRASYGGAWRSVEGAGGPAVAALPDRVRHVWVVDDLDAARRYLAGIMTAVPLPVPGSAMPTGADDATVCRLATSDYALQELVDRLAGAGGWHLTSPDLPQPRTAPQLAFSGKAVEYEIKLVAGKSGQR
jgi:hypothetical protein